MRDDARYILWKIAAGPNVHLVPRSKDTRQESSNDFLKLYDAVPLENIRNLLNFYKDDYRVFGYKIPDQIRKRLTTYRVEIN